MIWVEAVEPVCKSTDSHQRKTGCHKTFADVLQRAISSVRKNVSQTKRDDMGRDVAIRDEGGENNG